MPEVSTHAPGAFCWMELGTTDPAAAERFYGPLLGWEFASHDMPQGGAYTMIRHGGRDLAGMYALTPEMRKMGIPPHWLSYINVEDADEATNRAERNGAEIKMGPMDVMDIGRMTVLQDPSGAVVALWQAKSRIGACVTNESSTPCWFELVTGDRVASQKFYADTFGYDIHEQDMGGMKYTMLGIGESMQAGIMQKTPEMGDVPAHWMIYISVPDVDATMAKAADLGAQVIVPGMDLPVGRFGVFADPQGAVISVIQLAG